MLFSFFNSKGQEVNSKAYQLMLNGLLSRSVNEISVDSAKFKHGSAIFVDSREKNEFEVSHIENAIWVGYDNLKLNQLKKIDKEKEIIVYCSVGYRSEKVAEKLNQKGFKNVSNLYGGIFEWKNNKFPIVNSLNQLTDSVHAYNKLWGVWLNEGIKVYK